ncbi:hypothetical protein H072_3628 [Dactylellina haptotyla CBS 200.50]|uniref:Methyltransferase type 12 domain-containing protein n=1 Tax=Dactylellina haptotyla (strain CBS 200.50) TaxID=1284197 RepID=S8AMT9_DACHA|nr:hypothetical protein H072_3628 [Dactylellina haptotyla CBS 200.50]
MTDASNTRFNSEAESWDLNPDVQSATKSALSCLLERIPSLSLDNANKPRILDLGSGTGLLSIALSPYASQILSVDPSTGMISALEAKLNASDAPKNIKPLCALLTSPEDPAIPDSADGNGKQKYDVIVSNLVMHHIPDLPSFINLTYGLLAPGGVITLTDFENTGPEARKFHPEDKMEGVERHGLVRADMESMLKEAGFTDSKVEVAWVMRKQVERYPGEWNGGKPKEVALEKDEDKCMMDFNFLVVMGRK